MKELTHTHTHTHTQSTIEPYYPTGPAIRYHSYKMNALKAKVSFAQAMSWSDTGLAPR